MGCCPKGRRKRRTNVTHKGNPSDYRRSQSGHSWQKTEYGRICRKCGKKHLKPLSAEMMKKLFMASVLDGEKTGS